MLDPVPAMVARVMLALLFCASGWAKLRGAGRFAEAVAGYWPALARRDGLVTALRFLIAGGELVLALGLAWAAYRPADALLSVLTGMAAAAVLSGYGLVIARALAAGRSGFDCGCGGFAGRRQPVGWVLVARNLALAALAALAAIPVAARPLNGFDFVTVGAATLAGGLLYGAAETAWGLPRAAAVGRGGRQ